MSPDAALENRGHARLRTRFADVEVGYDKALGLPNRVFRKQGNARLAPAEDSPEDAATAFVQEQRELWGLSPADLSTLEIVGTTKKGLRTVKLKQRVGSRDVFGSDVSVAVSGMKEVISVSGVLFKNAGSEALRARRADRRVSPREAVAAGLGDLLERDVAVEKLKVAQQQDEQGDYQIVEAAAEGGAKFDRPARVKEVLFPLGGGEFVLGHYLELWPTGVSPHSYVIASDGTGTVLFRKNLSSNLRFEYRVFNTGDALLRPEDGPAPGTPHPTGIPDGYQAPVIAEKLVGVESVLLGRPWLPPNATRTEGNNCLAYADLVSPNGFQASTNDVFGEITSTGKFDYSYDHSKPASDPINLQNSLVGMFFHVNWLHDRWYEAGFDEASGNAQADNFGLGGEEGDPILAEGNDYSGTDNANMATPADGASPRMQMYEFVGPPGVSRTSNHEALITFHEMGHYITNRLVGDSSGLWNRQGRAMGEGHGDAFAICMTSQAGDDFVNGAFAVGGWTDQTASFNDNYYYSIRRYPYSADLGKNPLMFEHIQQSSSLPSGPPKLFSGANNQVHNAGEVWCVMLWEVFVNLVQKHGHEIAEKRMLKYVIGGLKLSPNGPTFTNARDGIVAAVTAMHPEDLEPVWQGFAKRGIGVDAVSPPSGSTTLNGVVQSFDIPAELVARSDRSSKRKVVLFDLGNTLEILDVLRPGAKEMLSAVAAMKDAEGRSPAAALLSDYFPATSEAHLEEVRADYIQLLNSLGIAEFFQPLKSRVTLSSDLSLVDPDIFKPDGRLFRLALERIGEGHLPGDTIFITESVSHVSGAQALGFQTLLVPVDLEFDLRSILPQLEAFVGVSSHDDERTGSETSSRVAANTIKGIRLGSKTFDIGAMAVNRVQPNDQQVAANRLHSVTQKGRAFERAHPEVRVLANHGRHLLIDIDPETAQTIEANHDFRVLSVQPGTTIYEEPELDALRSDRLDWVVEIVDKLDGARFIADLTHLATSFPTRLSDSPHYADASEWARTQLEAVGFEATFQEFSLGGGSGSRNVVGKMEGKLDARGLVVVGAHLDSFNQFGAIAPGADDNASGSAGLLEIARSLGGHDAQHDLHIVFFGGEEQGLFGSKHYVAELSPADRGRLRAVINMDMIGSLNSAVPTVLIEGSDETPGMQNLIDRLAVAAASYSSLSIKTSTNPFASDHVPFLEAGMPAVLTIEGNDSANGDIHTQNDTIDKIDVAFAMEILKANLAFVAEEIGRFE